jgi:hypothetical protein
MWTAIWEGIKGLFGGKGAMQIQVGKDNKAVTATITESSGTAIVGDNNVVNYHLPPAEKTIEFNPTPAEVEILTRLAKSPVGYLHHTIAESNFLVVIDGESLNSPYDGAASVKMKEAVDRLLRYKLLEDVSRNGEILHLSTKGKDAAEQIRKQLAVASKSEKDELVDWLRKNGFKEPVSHVVHQMQRLAQVVGNKEVEHWCQLELAGYFRDGDMADGEVIPNYRAVVGQFHDIYGQPLIVPSDLSFMNAYPLPQGTGMLEEWSKKTEMQNIACTKSFELIQKHFNVEVSRFTFSPLGLVNIVSAIRNHALRKAKELEK